jgi:hypothetical protein
VGQLVDRAACADELRPRDEQRRDAERRAQRTHPAIDQRALVVGRDRERELHADHRDVQREEGRGPVPRVGLVVLHVAAHLTQPRDDLVVGQLLADGIVGPRRRRDAERHEREHDEEGEHRAHGPQRYTKRT